VPGAAPSHDWRAGAYLRAKAWESCRSLGTLATMADGQLREVGVRDDVRDRVEGLEGLQGLEGLEGGEV
jgi:hypothetical protein